MARAETRRLGTLRELPHLALERAPVDRARTERRHRDVERHTVSELEQTLHDIGVYYFWQVADWTAQDIDHADAQLTVFHGRIGRDHWVAQARELAQPPPSSPRPG